MPEIAIVAAAIVAILILFDEDIFPGSPHPFLAPGKRRLMPALAGARRPAR